MTRHALVLFALAAAAPVEARADFLIRIGDVDGFGYRRAPGFKAANGGPANVDGAGVLTDGDFLPDIDQKGDLRAFGNDEFDFRTLAERRDNAVELGAGVIDVNTTGSRWTDISLSRNYDAKRQLNEILVDGNPNTGLIFGSGGPFPDGNSSTLPKQPGFLFEFEVDKSALVQGTPIYFNLIFGDYDVGTGKVRITRDNGTTLELDIQRQQNQQGQDGLIQSATVNLNFAAVFSNGGSVWKGKLGVDFIAENEPYTAFDYVELSTVPLVQAVPEPSTLVLGAVGGVLLGTGAWRRRRAR